MKLQRTEFTKAKRTLTEVLSLSAVFFMLGFLTSLNDILTPCFQSVYSLNYFQSHTVQFSFFTAYFVFSFVFFRLACKNADPVTKFGYKKTLIAGLLLSAISCLLVAVCVRLNLSFAVTVLTLFILGGGMAVIQIAVNTLVCVKKETASSRLNLYQAFNSLGTTLGPAVCGYFIFNYAFRDFNSIDSVFKPYMILCAVLLVISFFVYCSDIGSDIRINGVTSEKRFSLRNKHVLFSALAILFYVGAEVGIGSHLISYMKETVGTSERTASAFLSYYWGGAMIGRFVGAVVLSDIKRLNKVIYTVLLVVSVSVFLFLLTYGVYHLVFHQVWFFIVFIILNILFFRLAQGKTALTLSVFAMVNIGLITASFISAPSVSVWCILATGLFNSIMWSNIFVLSAGGLKGNILHVTPLLILMISGGAVFPLLQGWTADVIGIKYSFVIPVLLYGYLCFYGLKGYKI